MLRQSGLGNLHLALSGSSLIRLHSPRRWENTKKKRGEKSELSSSLILCCTAQVLNQMQLTAARKEWGFGQQNGSSPLWLDVVAIEMSAWLSHSTATKAFANRKKKYSNSQKNCTKL